MKASSLHALIIDRQLGELSPEAVELLEMHLSQHPESRAEAERVLRSLDATRDALLKHPELVRVPGPMERDSTAPAQIPQHRIWLALAASLVLLALVGGGGFLAGRASSPVAITRETAPPATMVVAQAMPRKASPWAQYRMSFDPAGQGMQVTRVDLANEKAGVIR